MESGPPAIQRKIIGIGEPGSMLSRVPVPSVDRPLVGRGGVAMVCQRLQKSSRHSVAFRKDGIAQHSEAVDFDLDHIAGLHRSDSGGGPGGDQIAWI